MNGVIRCACDAVQVIISDLGGSNRGMQCVIHMARIEIRVAYHCRLSERAMSEVGAQLGGDANSAGIQADKGQSCFMQTSVIFVVHLLDGMGSQRGRML